MNPFQNKESGKTRLLILPILCPTVNKRSPPKLPLEGDKLFSDEFIAFLHKTFMQTAKLLFVVAEMLGAVGTAETGVGIFKVTLGCEPGTQLPAEKQQQGQCHKHIGQGMPEENQGSEHHDKVPVIYTAAAAALVHHHPALEGAEEENADHVAHRIGEGNKNEHAPVDDSAEIQRKNQGIESDPEDNDRQHGFEGALSQGLFTGITSGAVILLEVLLAAHALELGGEEAKQHFQRENHRVNKRQKAVFKACKHAVMLDFANNI